MSKLSLYSGKEWIKPSASTRIVAFIKDGDMKETKKIDVNNNYILNVCKTIGGLNLKGNTYKLKSTINTLNRYKIRTSLFINPTKHDVKISQFSTL